MSIGMRNIERLQQIMQEDTENLPCEPGIQTTIFSNVYIGIHVCKYRHISKWIDQLH